MSAPPVPIGDRAELRRHLEAGGKARGRHRIGLEHEKIGVLASGRAPEYDDAIAPLLEGLAAQGGWERVTEHDRVIGLRRASSTVSLEPGGQFEFSGAPEPTAAAAAAALDAHLAELAGPARAAGVSWLGVGFRPFGTIDDVPWMPKGRYAVMRSFLPRRGRLAHEMMKRTATVQANLDFLDQADAAARVRTAMGVSSLVTALWAASPLVDGRPSGYQSYRAATWLDTDDARCGLLPFAFDDDVAERLFDRYVEWALDVPMFFLYRDGRYLPVEDLPFRRFLAEGCAGERATLADWEIHLSTLFAEVRLKPHVEVRSADAGTVGMVKALPALYRGLLEDDDARRAAFALVAPWSFDERVRLRAEVPRSGLQTTVRGRPILDACRELVAIARAGLARVGDDDPSLLAPVEEVAATARTRADEVVDAWHATGGDPARLVPLLRL